MEVDNLSVLYPGSSRTIELFDGCRVKCRFLDLGASKPATLSVFFFDKATLSVEEMISIAEQS